MLLSCAGAARDHGSHAVPESGTTNHHDVDQQEQYEKHGDEEMNGACGLLAAEHRHEGRKRGHAMAGDIARPVQIIKGNRTKITNK